jgi:hypothetical protein
MLFYSKMTSWVKCKTGLSVNRQARFAATSFSDDMQNQQRLPGGNT